MELYIPNDLDEQDRIFDIARRLYGLNCEIIDEDEYDGTIVEFSGDVENLRRFFENEYRGDPEEFYAY